MHLSMRESLCRHQRIPKEMAERNNNNIGQGRNCGAGTNSRHGVLPQIMKNNLKHISYNSTQFYITYYASLEGLL